MFWCEYTGLYIWLSIYTASNYTDWLSLLYRIKLFQRVLGLLRISDNLHFTQTSVFEPLDLINQMADAVYIERISSTTQLPRFRFDGDNRLDFLGGFPDIVAHFGSWGFCMTMLHIIDPMRMDQKGMSGTKWMPVALAKLKHYVTPGVHAIVCKGEQLTAREYYDRLNDMF